MKLQLLALALACGALPVFAQQAQKSEPQDRIVFKGNWVGMTIAEWKANRDNASDVHVNYGDADRWRRDRKKDIHIQGPWCSDGGVFIPEYLATMTPGDVLCVVAYPAELATTSVGDVKVSDLKYDFRDGKLIEIMFSYNSDSYPGVLSAFEAKYGKSDPAPSSHFENKFGATWAGENRFWKVGEVSIVVSEGSGNGPGGAAGVGGVSIAGPARAVASAANVNF